MSKRINVAIIGAGRAAQLHLDAYRKVHSINVSIKYLFDTDRNRAESLSKQYRIENIPCEISDIFNDPEINVVDICTPPYTHKQIIIDSFNNDKNVICEKPLCGYFGSGNTDGKIMYKSVQKDLRELEKIINKTDKQFFYAENFIYAPAIQRTAELIGLKKSKILFAKGEESLAGSSSKVANLWNKTGGGSLIRVGCHPISAILYLKKINNRSVHVTEITSDISCVTKDLSKKQHKYIKAQPFDVEDTAVLTLTFSDNTKANIIACDTRLGGSRNYIELYCNDSFYECNLTMNNLMKSYMLDEDKVENIELSEMLQTKKGWNYPFVSDEIIRGYTDEMQDFMECIAYNRKPKSDFNIAKETIDVIYQAYMNKKI